MPKDPAEYMRAYRDTPAGKRALAKQRRAEKARKLAMRTLAHRHLAEFNELRAKYLRDIEDEERD